MDGGIALTELLLKTKLAPSKGEGKRLIVQGGITIDDRKSDRSYGGASSFSAFEKGHILHVKRKEGIPQGCLS